MITLLDEIPLLVDRITNKINGLVTISPLDDYPNGGNFEADALPACFVGDSGDTYKFNSRQALSGLKDGHIFISVIVERKEGSFQQSKEFLDAIINCILYEYGNHERWQPDGYEYPFTLSDQRGPAIYMPTLVIRNIIFVSQKRLS